MTLTNHVTINITSDTLGVARLGFGTAAMVSYVAAWVERSRVYTDLAGVAADFPITTGAEYLCAQAYFTQNPHAQKFKIIRGALAPTQVYVITPSISHSTVFSVTAKGEGVTSETVDYTSDATNIVTETTAALETALNAVVGKNFTAVDNSTNVTVTADAAGDWFSLEVNDATIMKIEQTHVDPGIATDLTAIEIADSDWYCLLTNYNSNAMVVAADAWIQTRKKVYGFDVNETEAITTAAGNADTLDDIATLARARTFGTYHPSPADMNSAAWASARLAKDPGSATWKFTQLPGVTSTNLTSSHRANLVARSANFYETEAGIAFMSEGTTADGDFIDVQLGLDWLNDDMSARMFGTLVAADKIPFDDDGFATMEADMEASLDESVTRTILTADPAPTTVIPKLADISDADRIARNLTGMKFDGTLAGAIHKVTVTGVVS